MARWSMPIWRAARWDYWSDYPVPVLWRKLPGARSAGRVQSVALAPGLRPRARNRKIRRREYWSLVATLTTPRATPSRPAWSAPMARRFKGSTSAPAPKPGFQEGDRGRQFTVSTVEQNGAAQSTGAVHHLDAAAGSEPQARLRPGPHHAGGAAAV